MQHTDDALWDCTPGTAVLLTHQRQPSKSDSKKVRPRTRNTSSRPQSGQSVPKLVSVLWGAALLKSQESVSSCELSLL